MGRGWIKEENKNSENIQRRESYWESISLTRGEQIINYGAPLPWGRTGMPEGSRKWASLSFYRGHGQASTVGASHETESESWEKTHKSTHIQPFKQSLYAMLCWMKMVVVWQHNPRVLHHVIAVVSALLISAVPLGLYNWLRGCWQQWPHIYPRLPLMPVPKQVANTHQLETLHLDLPSIWNLDTFISWQTLQYLVLWWGDKAKQLSLISPKSSQGVSHGQSW